jgi:hypothetical protein
MCPRYETCSESFTRCAPGLEALRQHRVDYDEKTRSFKKTAKEDWTCDAADAFRHVAMAWREIVKVPEPPKKRLFVPTDELSIHEWSGTASAGTRA